jgi:hypothetical protein
VTLGVDGHWVKDDEEGLVACFFGREAWARRFIAWERVYEAAKAFHDLMLGGGRIPRFDVKQYAAMTELFVAVGDAADVGEVKADA